MATISPPELVAEPTRTACPQCLSSVIVVQVGQKTITADPWEWQPLGKCLSCLRTRSAHPGAKVSCAACNDTGMVGQRRPAPPLLAIDLGWGDDQHVRLITTTGSRRRTGEALYELHRCPAMVAA